MVHINDDCSVNETSHFDTHRLDSVSESDNLRDYILNLPNNTRIAGVTYDEFFHNFQDNAKDALIDVGLDLGTASYRSSICFVFVTGKPQQTKQNQAESGKGPIMLSTTI